jgi:16S rRNA (cytosine967-C5)-methyltransferase
MGALLRSPQFQQGLFSIQNPAADLLVRLLDPQMGEHVWDACAAPGGKSALILERCPQLHLTASDSDARRLESLQDLETRLNLRVAKIVACDASKPFFEPMFHRILLDVPCSNLGVMTRRPEVAQRLDRKSFETVVEKQEKILAGAAKCLLPGGVLVYGTCSPEPEETVQVIQKFLSAHPDFKLEPAEKFVEKEWVKDHFVHAGNTELGFDWFFGARLRRNA